VVVLGVSQDTTIAVPHPRDIRHAGVVHCTFMARVGGGDRR